jgi:hypothetical protein
MVTKHVEFSLTTDRTKEKKKNPDILNIYQRLNGVMKDVKTIYKDGTNAHQKYKFVSHDNVSKALHDPLCDHGIMMVPTVKDCIQDGNKLTVTMEVSFVNIDDPDDRVTVEAMGMGIDNQDKGIGKAISYAMKYCMLKMFCLETGDDADNESVAHRAAAKSLKVDPEIAFNKIIPTDIDEGVVEGFVMLKAQQNNATRDKVMASAVANKEAFIKAMREYEEDDAF